MVPRKKEDGLNTGNIVVDLKISKSTAEYMLKDDCNWKKIKAEARSRLVRELKD